MSDLNINIAERVEWVSRRFNFLPGDVFQRVYALVSVDRRAFSLDLEIIFG